jgi:hypothetical protein
VNRLITDVVSRSRTFAGIGAPRIVASVEVYCGAEGVGVGTYQVVPPAKRAVTCGQIRLVCVALKRLHGQCKDIPDAALRPYDARRAHVSFQFAPQPQHLYVDAPIENVFVHAGGLEELLAGEWPLRSLQKCHEQGIFAFGQRHGNLIRAYQAAVVAFEFPAAKFKSAPLWLARSGETAELVPPQNCPDARKQFSEAERLGHVVVRTEFEADHAIDFLQPVPGGDDHGNIGVGSNLS